MSDTSEKNSVFGHCLCGGVTYRVNGPLTDVCNCHCSMCRRQSGAAFGTAAHLAEGDFQWISGESLVSEYQSSQESSRIFCGVCGSNLGVMEDGHVTYISIGAITDESGVRPSYHIFVGSKAAWYEIEDDLPRYVEWQVPD